MKFRKILCSLIEETLPEWRDKFLSYKDLKKQVKLIYPKPKATDEPLNKRPRLDAEALPMDGPDFRDADDNDDDPEVSVSKEFTDFVRLLEDEIDKFNGFFVDQEEEYVIKWKELQDKITKGSDFNEELTQVGRELVDFHGEMVLLENYSALNYTGLVKILKKYDKRSGALIRLPFIQKVLQEPFFSTEVLNKLVKECEGMLDHLFSKNDLSGPLEATNKEEASYLSKTNKEEASHSTNNEEASHSTNNEEASHSTNKEEASHSTNNEEASHSTNNEEASHSETASESKETQLTVPKELPEIEHMVKRTLSALRVLKEIRSGSSTVSEFSLPPLQNNALGEWKNITAIEQAAK